MFNAFLYTARASVGMSYPWHHIAQHAGRLLYEASPRAIVLASPHIPWYYLTGDSVQQWAAAASKVPYTEEVGQNVVDTLLQIASESKLLPHISVDIWLWLTKRPSLPPLCQGRYGGTHPDIVKAVRALKDLEILKSYLLLVWSEWDGRPSIGVWERGYRDICASTREDFGGVRNGHHRADLIQRLDCVLGQLDLGLEHLKQHNPHTDEYDMQKMRRQYGELKEILLEADMKAIGRAPHLPIMPLHMLTPAPCNAGSPTAFMCSLPLACP